MAQIVQTSSVGYRLKTSAGFERAWAIYAGWGRWQCFDRRGWNVRIFGRRRALRALENYAVTCNV